MSNTPALASASPQGAVCQECLDPAEPADDLEVITYDPIAQRVNHWFWHHNCWEHGTRPATVSFRAQEEDLPERTYSLSGSTPDGEPW